MAKNSFGIQDAYKSYPFKKNIEGRIGYGYVKLSERTDHKYSVNLNEYKLIITTFCEVFIDILFLGLKVPLPSSLGYLQLVKNKNNTPPVDYVESRKQKRLVRGNNNHTNNYVVRCKWFRFGRDKFPFVNKKVFAFALNRGIKSQLAKKLKDGFLIDSIREY